MKNKMKVQKKKEEKERKRKGKTQGEELKESLADNDDSSSTTTETSNPDTETNIKEVFYIQQLGHFICNVGQCGLIVQHLHGLFLLLFICSLLLLHRNQ